MDSNLPIWVHSSDFGYDVLASVLGNNTNNFFLTKNLEPTVAYTNEV